MKRIASKSGKTAWGHWTLNRPGTYLTTKAGGYSYDIELRRVVKANEYKERNADIIASVGSIVFDSPEDWLRQMAGKMWVPGTSVEDDLREAFIDLGLMVSA